MSQFTSFTTLLLITGSAALASPRVELLPPNAEVDALKRSYLDCEVAAQSGRLDGAGIAACSVIYEDLKRVAFGGSVPDLRAWYESTRALGVKTRVQLQLAD